MALWEKVRNDAQKSLREGLNAIKLKAEELTGEGKRKYKLFEIKSKVHNAMADLGGKVYGLSAKKKNPLEDRGVKGIITRLKKMELQIKKLEKAGKKKPAKKKPAKKKAARKKAVKKKAAKKAA
jgi:hypothetical protein